ncbi:MAG: helix-turn-helix domain-containing protein [Solirubrobacterales bacterium]
MATKVGKTLQKARLGRGIDLTEVERVTKIRVKFLRAMEEDRWDDLPPPAYARSFLQTYARYLGLDDEALVEEYRENIEPDDAEKPIPSGIIRSGTIEPHRSLRPIAFVLGGLAAAAGVALIVAAIASSGGSGTGGTPKRHHGRPATSTSTGTGSTTTTTTGSELSLEVSPTADVWVCLVDERGRHLVDGETLTTGDTRGPFSATGFEVTFGNGSVQMTVNGQPADIPPSASPINYRISSTAVKQLASGSGPSCS